MKRAFITVGFAMLSGCANLLGLDEPSYQAAGVGPDAVPVASVIEAGGDALETGPAPVSNGGHSSGDGGNGGDGCTPTTHDDGFGQSWTNCNPIGTYTASEALQACTLYIASNPVLAHECYENSIGCPGELYVFAASPTLGDVAWVYSGPLRGYVIALSNCSVLSDSSSHWF